MSVIEIVDDDQVAPACGIARQCSDATFRDSTPRQVGGVSTDEPDPDRSFFTPCRNPECYPDRDPEPGETVVVARGRGTGSMHAPDSDP